MTSIYSWNVGNKSTVIVRTQNNLILIDEIDLLLHNEALERLLNVVTERAKNKNLQLLSQESIDNSLAA